LAADDSSFFVAANVPTESDNAKGQSVTTPADDFLIDHPEVWRNPQRVR
jgi:hypothetical protein